MKTNKSPESTEVTPSKKKLKQARLPFKLISDSPPAVAPQTRKRKLSAPDAESVPKVGKISKENDIIEDPVVISDDDSKDGQKVIVKDDNKQLNPFVKLVDTAWKKKLEKSKKKRGNKKKSLKKQPNGSVDTNESANDTGDDKDTSELMDVDAPETDDNNENFETPKENGIKENDTKEQETSEPEPTETSKNAETTDKSIKPQADKTDIVVLEDSNNSSDVAASQKSNVEQEKGTDIQSTDKDTNESPEKEADNKAVTPKRSARIKANVDETNNSTLSSSKLDESMCSEPATPKQNRSSSVTSVGDESMNDSTRKLTPKQVQKKLESAKKKEEREKERLEREKKKQEEKEERARQRLEKEEQKKKEREEKEEAKRKEREEKEEAKKREREEKEEQKKKEKEEKEKLREEKEEQRRKEKEAREEEKRKKQEALELEKQEQELKKKKAAEAFVNFFVPKQKAEKDQPTVGPVSKNNVLSSFTIKADMRLAPTVRVDLSEEKKDNLDGFLKEQNVSESSLYLKSLKNGVKPLSSGKTWPLSDKDEDDVIIVEDELPPIHGAGEIITCDTTVREKLRPKLLKFEENRRPPYWGTWRKKSAFVKPRKPFGQDKQLDYEVDSDDDWEEEQEGESIDGSAAGSDDEQDADEYEVDNEVFVPHGYLSDEEATMDEDDVLSLSPETQKARLKHLEDEFESEMKKPTEKLKPRLYGLLWETSDGGKPEKCVDALWNYFGKLSMIMNDPTSLLQPSNETDDAEKKKVKKKKVPVAEGEEQSPKVEKKKKAKPENKESKKPKTDPKKNIANQPGINSFLTKMKT